MQSAPLRGNQAGMRDEQISAKQGEEKPPAIFLPTGLKQPFPESHPALGAAFPAAGFASSHPTFVYRRAESFRGGLPLRKASCSQNVVLVIRH